MKRFLGLPWAVGAAITFLLALFVASDLGGAGSPAAAASVSLQIGMKVLLITQSTDNTGDAKCTTTPPICAAGIAYWDWVNTLYREGVPFDSVVTSPAAGDPAPAGASTFTALPALSSTAADGTQVANYEGVVVAGSGTQGMTTVGANADWPRLQTFEHQFSARQVTAYAVPSSDYGMNAPNPAGGGPLTPGQLSLTHPDGSGVFPYLNQVNVDPTFGTWAYEGTPMAGANVDTLIAGPNSSTLLGIYTSADGRQAMFQTFNENQYYLQSELLRHGELDWLTRNTYFGDQRNYLETNIDDNFLSDESWNATTHATDFTAATALREMPSDITTATTWSQQHNFRIDMLFNGGGSVQAANGGTDPLLSQFQTTDPATGKPYTDDFGWINHTWDHPNLDEGCATPNYIVSEITQNATWAATAAAGGSPTKGGLGLTNSTTPTDALGNDNPNAIVTGEHAGLANLIPGNPGQVDPPFLNNALAATTGGTLATGEYVYAVSDQFNTALPGATPVPGPGESAASVSSAVPVTGPTGAVTLDWAAVCHAADYKIYRAPYTPATPPATGGTTGAWSLIQTVLANTATDFTDTGPVDLSYTDTGASAGTAATPPTAGSADEGPYEQNPALDAAFPGAKIKYFGSDASKPYPSPADWPFTTLAPGSTYGGAESPIASTFSDAGATAIPRYPTNIYYNVATNAQEIDEYNTLYLPVGDGSGACGPPRTDCFPTGSTPYTSLTPIVASVDQGMWLHMMSNDPRPTYFHQTNLMNVNPGLAPDPSAPNANALFYQTVDPLLASYSTYFASNAPIEQFTMAQIGTLLYDQAAWALANRSQISGNIEGNTVTVTNNSLTATTDIPLTGVSDPFATPYAGTRSGWTPAKPGTSTYTAMAAWPALPTTPPQSTPPTGPAPGGPPATGGKPIHQTPPPAPAATHTEAPLYYVAVQVAPKTVSLKNGTASVSLKCEAKNGKPVKNHFCTGTFRLTVMGKTVRQAFRIKATKTARIAVKLPKKAVAAAASGKHRTLHGALAISTKQPTGAAKLTRGTLNIKT
jgi:hypothetical protein